MRIYIVSTKRALFQFRLFPGCLRFTHNYFVGVNISSQYYYYLHYAIVLLLQQHIRIPIE